MESKHTAVEWLIEQLTPSISLQQTHIDEYKKQAKEMEKEHIMDAYRYGNQSDIYFKPEQYYIETYGK